MNTGKQNSGIRATPGWDELRERIGAAADPAKNDAIAKRLDQLDIQSLRIIRERIGQALGHGPPTGFVDNLLSPLWNNLDARIRAFEAATQLSEVERSKLAARVEALLSEVERSKLAARVEAFRRALSTAYVRYQRDGLDIVIVELKTAPEIYLAWDRARFNALSDADDGGGAETLAELLDVRGAVTANNARRIHKCCAAVTGNDDARSALWQYAFDVDVISEAEHTALLRSTGRSRRSGPTRTSTPARGGPRPWTGS